MKIRPDQLQHQFTKQIAPIYIVSGDDVLLCQEVSDQIRQHLMHEKASERLRFSVDAQFDWQDVIQENQSLSLFANARLFDIQIDKMAEKHSKALTQIGQSLNQDNVFLIRLPKLDTRTQKTKWFSQLEQQGVFIQVWPIDPPRMPQWVQQRAQTLGLKLSKEASEILCEHNEGNLLALAQELDKLFLTYGSDTTISVEMVTDAVSNSSRYSIYDLSDRLLLGKAKEALHCLDSLLAEGTEPNILLWLLNREVAALVQLDNESQTTGFRQACQKQRIWDKRIPFYEAAYQRHNLSTLTYMQNYIALLDQKIKGLDGPDMASGFRNSILMFCGIKPVSTELDYPSLY